MSGRVFHAYRASNIQDAREEGRWAWYSEKAAAQFGTAIYYDENFNEIEVTSVQSEESRENPTYGWDDKVDVGKVLCYLDKGRTGYWENLSNEMV